MDEYDLNKGTTFLSGFFDGTVVERVQLYHNGISVEGRAATETLDTFIDDALAWVERERGLRVLPNEDMPKLGRAYASQVVVELVGPTQGATQISPMQPILDLISRAVAAGGLQSDSLAMTGITFGPDPATGAGWFFRLERRVTDPFSANKFFSSAPLQTAAHLALISDIQKLTAPTASLQPS